MDFLAAWNALTAHAGDGLGARELDYNAMTQCAPSPALLGKGAVFVSGNIADRLDRIHR